MRDELKKSIEDGYWIYGLDKTDFDYILRLTYDYINCRRNEFEIEKKKALSDYPDPEIHGEIISDLAHYTWVDEQYLWQFCLWRFQGIFEAIIVHNFLPKKSLKKMFGLKAKLDAIIPSGYKISDEEYRELIDWADLRNALSHSPPEQYTPGQLRESDILEYKRFLEMLCDRWENHNKLNKNES